MYSDREWLELAAKARGGIESDEDFGLIDPEKDTATQAWNPLTDDGDALRLAVKLGLKIERHDEYYPYFSAEKKDVVFVVEDVIKNNGNECRATRRAIVRAAAAIGEAMQ